MATAQNLETKLRKVTVFQDRAQLHREAVVALTPGDHTFTIEGLWRGVDRDTLQVGTKKGREQVVLRSVQFTTVSFTEDVRPERAKLDAELKPLEEQLTILNNKLTVEETALSSYNALLKKVTSTKSEKFNPALKDPKTLVAFHQFVSKGLTEHTAKKRSVEKEKNDLQEKINEVKRKRNALGSSDHRQKTKDVAEILIQARAQVELHLTISYIVHGPSWVPMYDLRVDSANKTLDVLYNATVKQATHETWTDVTLELSTAKQFGASPPKAEPWPVGFYVPPVVYGGRRLGGRSRGAPPGELAMMQQMMAPPAAQPQQMMQMMNVMPEIEMDDALEEDGFGGEPEATRMATEAARVTQSSTSATFEIAGFVTVKPDGEPVRVSIVQQSFGAYFRYSAVPKLSNHTYLKVKVVNTTAYTFLPGKTNIFADNQYVSNSVMNLVAPNEEFWTFIGIDDAMSVEREQLIKKSSTEGWVSKSNHVEYRYKFTVKNKKKTTEEIVLWDQLPIPEDKKIKVNLIRPSTKMGDEESGEPGCDPKYMIDKDQFIEWFVLLKPQEERQFYFEFAVESPKDDTVIGI